MRIVHWNTHHGGVPINPNGISGQLNVQGITDWLIKFNPDYISLNELEQNDGYGQLDQLEYHRRSLETAQNKPWFASFTQMNGGAKNQGIGIGLLTSSPLLIVDRKKLVPDRPAMYAKTSFGSMYTLHAAPDSNRSRNIQLNQVLCWIADKTPFIACGDFNCSPSDLELASWNIFYKDAGSRDARPTHGKHRIDYIWYRGLELVSYDVPNTSVDGIYPSDHNPVVAEFK